MKLGIDAKMYRLTSGTRAAWPNSNAGPAPDNLTEVTNVRDLSIDLTKEMFDALTRGGGKFGQNKGTVKAGNVTFGAIYDPADTQFAALLAAAVGDSTVSLAVLDGNKATVGTQGLWAEFEISLDEKTENLREGQVVTFSLYPAYSSVPAAWVTVGAGS